MTDPSVSAKRDARVEPTEDAGEAVTLTDRASEGPTGARDTPLVRRLDDWNAARLRELAAEYGTPTYVIDLDRVRANYRRLADAFDCEVSYAAKANTGPGVLRTVVDAGGTIECAGRGELRRALAAGATVEDLRYTAVNPPAADLDAVCEVARDTSDASDAPGADDTSDASDAPGFTVVAGAWDTFERLRERGYDGRVGLRVNPGVGTGHHEAVATGKDAQFGVPADRAPVVADRLRESGFEFVGVHAHVGSGVLPDEVDDHLAALERVAEIARAIGTEDLSFVDVGGGFGVPYRPDERPLRPADLAPRVESVVGSLDADLIVEPGRYVVADAGVILTRVNTVKETPASRVVGVDASLATLVRPAMFDAHHPIRSLASDDRERVACAVGGPCCTSADTFCTDRPLARPERGDVLAIGNAGAYGYELTSRFHSQPRPTEVAATDGETRVSRGGETIDDVLATDVW